MTAQEIRQEPCLTPEEYLARERRAEVKSEYVCGKIVAMSGASRRHNLISLNVGTQFNTQLATSPCEAYTSDIRVRVSEAGAYRYPDVVVACGEPQFEDRELDTLLNPTVIVEVLSDSTEETDRGSKFVQYRQIQTLTDYLLISQNRICIEHYTRQTEQQWLFVEVTDLAATISLPSIGCVLRLSEVYRKVRFAESETF